MEEPNQFDNLGNCPRCNKPWIIHDCPVYGGDGAVMTANVATIEERNRILGVLDKEISRYRGFVTNGGDLIADSLQTLREEITNPKNV